MLVVAALAAGLVAVPDTAHAEIPVLCNESSATAINVANAAGGGTLAPAPFCTHALTSALGSALEVDGNANVPGTQGRLNLVSVTIRGGSAVAPYHDGGIPNRRGALSLTSSRVTGNTAVAGRGTHTDNGAVSLTASTITGNTATSSGCGVHRNSGAVNLPASNGSRNTPDNYAPSGSVPACAG
ncbi:hypothetical protein [Streptomyces sp. NPDC060366]|uniref:hypothetical protein n=1 Tax=Streptomyces sp. NPDC060366 TaxID=3347105 RepID=UPI0036596A55